MTLCRSLLLAATAVFSSIHVAKAQQRPAITGIAFTRFYAADPVASQHFYRDTLGYSGIAAGNIMRYPVNALQWIEVEPITDASAPSRMAAVGFTTRDVRALSRYLTAKGVTPEQTSKDGSFSVRDPEGNLIYFVQSGSNRAVAHAAASPRSTSNRIIHAGFNVKSAAAEDRFYRDILGFHPYWHGGMKPERVDWSSVQVPEGSDWLEYMLETPRPGDRKVLGILDHVSLGTPDMQQVVARLKSNGCEGADCTRAQMGKDGKMQLNMFDPDLTRVEYMEFAPKQEPCCSPFTGKQPTSIEDR